MTINFILLDKNNNVVPNTTAKQVERLIKEYPSEYSLVRIEVSKT